MDTLTSAEVQQATFARLTRQVWPVGAHVEVWQVDLDALGTCNIEDCSERGHCLVGELGFCADHLIAMITDLADFVAPWCVEIDVARPQEL